MKTSCLLAPAKLNLSLHIVGKLANGYHALEMVMQSIDLFDVITVTAGMSGNESEKISITCSDPSLPTGPKNIAYKCADEFLKYTGIDRGKAIINIQKHIPVQAGLAGGSADGAAVLVGLNEVFSTGLSSDELCELGVKCGSDIPFCIKGGTMLAEGIGEKLSPLCPLPPCFIALAKPDCGVNTAQAFSKYDDLSTHGAGGTKQLIAALRQSELSEIGKRLSNALEPACAPEKSKQIKQMLLKSGAAGAVMTGSGSAVFGLFDSESAAADALKKAGAPFSRVCRPVDHGVTKAPRK